MRTDDDRNDRMTQGGSTGSSQADLSQAPEQGAQRSVAEPEQGAGDPETRREETNKDAASSDKTAHAETAPQPVAQDEPARPPASMPVPEADGARAAEVSAQGDAQVTAREDGDDRDQNDLVIHYDLQMSSRVEGEPEVKETLTEAASPVTTAEAAPVLAQSDDGWADAMRSRLDDLSGRIDGMTGGRDDSADADNLGDGLRDAVEALRSQDVDLIGRSGDDRDATGGLSDFRAQADQLMETWTMDRNLDDAANAGEEDLLSQIRDRSGDEGAREPAEADTLFAAIRDRLGDQDEDEEDGRPDIDDVSYDPHSDLIAEDAGFSDSSAGGATWMSRMFEGTGAAGSSPALGNASSAFTADDLNLPADWPINDAGSGFTGWDGVDLGG